MITVSLNDQRFEYDVRALMKSFFFDSEVKLVSDEEPAEYRLTFSNGTISFSREDKGFERASYVAPGTPRPEEKNILKQLIYEAMSEYTGRTLAWGNLSGIRPTKIPMKLLTEGIAEEEILRRMQETYSISEEKGRLCIDIAKREYQLLNSLHDGVGYSLYIGIPFCPTTCLYCSFTSNPIALWKGRVELYLEALFKEIDYVKEYGRDKILDTIYIGGGTPTTLTAEELDRLLCKLEDSLDMSGLLEFTVEAGRADSITIDKLRVLKRHGVTRISVNPQTMNQKTLDIIGRRHTVEDVMRAYADAREAGFNNINMDIIMGLPEEGIKEVTHTIDEIVKMAPDSLTVHSLAIKRASGMHEWIEHNGYKTMINTAETMKIAEQGALRLGMKPYYLYRQKDMAGNFENTGYAKEGKFGVYNILIMEEVQTILAVGAGTVTKRVYEDGSCKRCDTIKDVGMYIDKIDEMIGRKRVLFSK